jgi:hypothetical protein
MFSTVFGTLCQEKSGNPGAYLGVMRQHQNEIILFIPSDQKNGSNFLTAIRPGLPDFSRNNVPKWAKITQMS